MQKKKKSLLTQIDLYYTNMVHHAIPKGNINYPRSTNKIKFFDEIFTCGKNCRFNERPKI